MENDNLSTLFFHTTAEWTIDELQIFSKSIGEIYDAFLSIHIRQKQIENYFSLLDEYLFRFEKNIGEPYSYELFRFWRKTIKDWRFQHKMLPLSFKSDWSFPFPFQEFDRVIPNLDDIYQSIDFYKNSNNNLRIYQIHISSPGLFSFEGLGEIVHEIRELIKDLFWRNKQDKAKGQLEIISGYLKIRKENPDLNIPIPTYLKSEQYLIDVVNDNINNLRLLEDKGKLLKVAENIDKPQNKEDQTNSSILK